MTSGSNVSNQQLMGLDLNVNTLAPGGKADIKSAAKDVTFMTTLNFTVSRNTDSQSQGQVSQGMTPKETARGLEANTGQGAKIKEKLSQVDTESPQPEDVQKISEKVNEACKK